MIVPLCASERLGSLGRIRSVQTSVPPASACSLRVLSPSLDATELVAASLAAVHEPGDLLLLRGEVGAGKTAFCRAFVRAATRSPELEVPSPTFTLRLDYASARGTPVIHVDAYRCGRRTGQARLGLEADAPRAVTLVEWPGRLADAEGVVRAARACLSISLAE
ncbi:hypothetical protein H632_c2224p1, partial [Helicosporidium sp. ATCC 50920]